MSFVCSVQIHGIDFTVQDVLDRMRNSEEGVFVNRIAPAGYFVCKGSGLFDDINKVELRLCRSRPEQRMALRRMKRFGPCEHDVRASSQPRVSGSGEPRRELLVRSARGEGQQTLLVSPGGTGTTGKGQREPGLAPSTPTPLKSALTGGSLKVKEEETETETEAWTMSKKQKSITSFLGKLTHKQQQIEQRLSTICLDADAYASSSVSVKKEEAEESAAKAETMPTMPSELYHVETSFEPRAIPPGETLLDCSELSQSDSDSDGESEFGEREVIHRMETALWKKRTLMAAAS